MSTVLRVKRRIDDGPSDVLVIASKKRKVDESEVELHSGESSDAVTAVVKFAGTVKTQEEDLTHHLTKTLSKEELKANYKQHIVDITKKSRIKRQNKSKDSRYRIVNFYRSLGGPTIEEIDDNGMTVIDVEDSVSCTNNQFADDKTKYVYDLYYTQTKDKLELDDYFSIHPLDDQELVFDNNYKSPENDCDDGESEDSNSESNWRTEYPDSEHSDGDSVDEDDMRAAVARLKFDSEESSDLSTDNDDFVYAVDENDVNNFGYKYARYKAKIKEEFDDEKDSDLSDYSGICITEEPDGNEKDEEKEEEK